MNRPEMRKHVLGRVFRRHGRDGQYTRLFDDLEPRQKAVLTGHVPLHEGELPVIGHVESDALWAVITNERVVWRRCGETKALPMLEIRDIMSQERKLVETKRRMREIRDLVIDTVSGEREIVELEPGPPLTGVWTALMHQPCRNRSRRACPPDDVR